MSDFLILGGVFDSAWGKGAMRGIPGQCERAMWDWGPRQNAEAGEESLRIHLSACARHADQHCFIGHVCVCMHTHLWGSENTHDGTKWFTG